MSVFLLFLFCLNPDRYEAHQELAFTIFIWVNYVDVLSIDVYQHLSSLKKDVHMLTDRSDWFNKVGLDANVLLGS